jgi:hypothetical protein
VNIPWSEQRGSRSARGATCQSCGARYDDGAWLRLTLSRTLAPLELRNHVLEWPDRECVEVRSCTRCHHLIAARRSIRT